jgi:hypothetical protein
MNRPSLAQGIFTALVLALGVSVASAALAPLVAPGVLTFILVSVASLCYLVYLLRAAGSGTGRATVLAFWAALGVTSWWLAPPLPVYVMIHVGAIWLIRALYFHARPLPALLDLGLSGLAACALAWSAANTGSIFMATWFFFLVQAFFVVVPEHVGKQTSGTTLNGNASFERARQRADEALRTLARRA